MIGWLMVRESGPPVAHAVRQTEDSRWVSLCGTAEFPPDSSPSDGDPPPGIACEGCATVTASPAGTRRRTRTRTRGPNRG